ncbi:MAG TPA: invasion associated locus B family protein [Xanthobacteraceae bacterium]|nr:invasion associated locus B family protein [Xanthobacteraceae bacterium]
MKLLNYVTGGLAGLTIAMSGAAWAQLPPPAKPPAPRPAAPAQPTQRAQAPAAAPAPAAPAGQEAPATDVPQQTTATYGDWILQCATLSGQTTETCDMVQVTQVQGKPFSRLAMTKPEKGQVPKLVVQVPVNVTFATNVKIQTTDEDPGLTMAFATCTPNGCFALFDLKEETMKKFRTASSNGSFSFADSTGRPIKIPVSYNGFAQAFEALLKK